MFPSIIPKAWHKLCPFQKIVQQSAARILCDALRSNDDGHVIRAVLDQVVGLHRMMMNATVIGLTAAIPMRIAGCDFFFIGDIPPKRKRYNRVKFSKLLHPITKVSELMRALKAALFLPQGWSIQQPVMCVDPAYYGPAWSSATTKEDVMPQARHGDKLHRLARLHREPPADHKIPGQIERQVFDLEFEALSDTRTTAQLLAEVRSSEGSTYTAVWIGLRWAINSTLCHPDAAESVQAAIVKPRQKIDDFFVAHQKQASSKKARIKK